MKKTLNPKKKMGRHRKSQKWIFIRDGFPFKGGSSTFLYLLFAKLKDQMPRAEYWNVVRPKDIEFGPLLYGDSWSNPRKIDRVRTLLLDGKRGKNRITRIIRQVKPDGVISKSRTMTVFLKQHYPHLWVEHVTSTCGQIKEAVARGTLKSLEEGFHKANRGLKIAKHCPEEEQTVRLADRIHFHSDSVRFWYWYFYPDYRFKMAEDVYWDFPILKKHFDHLEKPKSWKARTFDVLFAATDWKRPEKNFELLKAICKKLNLSRKRVAVVGLSPEELPKEIMRFPVVSQDELYYLMCDSRVFACPSRYDEAPNVLFEASLAQCSIVCSSNCGNFRLAAPELRSKLTAEDFALKIRKGLKGPLKGDLEAFTKRDLTDLFLKDDHHKK